MEDYSRRRHLQEGYEFVNSPHITRAGSTRSGHRLLWTACTAVPHGPGHDAEGRVTRQGGSTKPMNCPCNLIFRARQRSYRELRCGCSSSAVYRNEKSGVARPDADARVHRG